MQILLFDMDDVLLEAHGYHAALIETVAILADALGYQQTTLSPTAIEIFEAARATSEWDSAAICHALLLRTVWQLDPGRALESAPPLRRHPPHSLPLPDFIAYFRRCLLLQTEGEVIALARQDLLADPGLNAWQRTQLDQVLSNARQIHASLTHRIIQEQVLGSELFRTSYSIAPHWKTIGTLRSHDQPTLSQDQIARLRLWLANPEHHAALLTNRPNHLPQNGGGTPEAEIGLELLGLSRLPTIGYGSLTWLWQVGGQRGEIANKPSPIHALAAVRIACGSPTTEALRSAADLAHNNVLDPGWQELQGAEVIVFEDSVRGLISVRQACTLLARHAIRLRPLLIGITNSAEKRKPLEGIADQVYPRLPTALQALGILEP